jgi:hypothetical protein
MPTLRNTLPALAIDIGHRIFNAGNRINAAPVANRRKLIAGKQAIFESETIASRTFVVQIARRKVQR